MSKAFHVLGWTLLALSTYLALGVFAFWLCDCELVLR